MSYVKQQLGVTFVLVIINAILMVARMGVYTGLLVKVRKVVCVKPLKMYRMLVQLLGTSL